MMVRVFTINVVVAFMKHRLILLTILTAVSLVSIGVSESFAFGDCQFPDPPRTYVTMAKKKTYYIRGQSARNLTEMHYGRQSNFIVQGLAGGEIWYDIKTKYRTEQIKNKFCTGIDAVKITFYGVPQVYIASNFPRGTCEYRAILEHEQKHIRTMLKFMREQAPDFKRFAKNMTKHSRWHIGPVKKSDIESAKQDLYANYDKQLESYLIGKLQLLSARQKGIDNPVEYARVDAQCDNWDKYLFAR